MRPATILRQRLAITSLATYAILLVAAGFTQLVDPFIHYDDYPALVLDPEGYYSKTLNEGRWFNYWWHLRGFMTPAWLNFQFYLVGWSIFVAAAALNVFRSSDLRFPLLLAALIVLSPQTTLISGWFNTLIPGIWLLAAYSVTALFVTPAVGQRLLFLVIPISIQAYTTYPFLLLAICLMREDQNRSLRQLLGLLSIFGVAFALGILIMYSMNYFVHDVFGLALAEWREPRPAAGLADLFGNFGKVTASLEWIYTMTGFGRPALSLIICAAFAGSLLIVWRKSPVEVLYIIVGMLSGLSLLVLHALQEGIIFPFRSTYFLWFLLSIALMRAVFLVEAQTGRKSSAPIALAMVFALTVGSLVRVHNQSLSAWQNDTRILASHIYDASSPVYVYGSYLMVNGYGESRAQMPRDLQYRLSFLTGAWVEMCSETPESCSRVTPPFEVIQSDGPPMVKRSGAQTFIRLPFL